MTSSNGDIFRVAGPLWWESIDHRWLPFTKAQQRGVLMFSLIRAWTNSWVNNRDADDFRRHCAPYDVTVMIWVIDHMNPLGTYNRTTTKQSKTISLACMPNGMCWISQVRPDEFGGGKSQCNVACVTGPCLLLGPLRYAPPSPPPLADQGMAFCLSVIVILRDILTDKSSKLRYYTHIWCIHVYGNIFQMICGKYKKKELYTINIIIKFKGILRINCRWNSAMQMFSNILRSNTPIGKKCGLSGMYNGYSRIWNPNFLQMTWHQPQTSIQTLMHLSLVVSWTKNAIWNVRNLICTMKCTKSVIS